MATEKTPNYTSEQESIILGWNDGGALSFADATAIAADPRMNTAEGEARKPRSIVAKINRLCPDRYANKAPTRKDGSAVESKAKLVEQIAAAAGVTFEGLDKAARGDLVKLRDFVRKAA
jgi:hypothetical protein